MLKLHLKMKGVTLIPCVLAFSITFSLESVSVQVKVESKLGVV